MSLRESFLVTNSDILSNKTRMNEQPQDVKCTFKNFSRAKSGKANIIAYTLGAKSATARLYPIGFAANVYRPTYVHFRITVCLTASFLSTRLRPSGVISNIICSRSPTRTLFCDFRTVTPLVVLAVVSYLGHSKKILIDWLIDHTKSTSWPKNCRLLLMTEESGDAIGESNITS